MTRPIYEPSPSRWSAALDYGEQQLFRRPGPPQATAGLPFSTIEWSAPTVGDFFSATSGVRYSFFALTLAGGGTIDFTWGLVSVSGADIFFPSLDSGRIDWASPIGSTSNCAFMVAEAAVQWEDSFPQRVVTWVQIGQSAMASTNGPDIVASISAGDLLGLPASNTQQYVGLESSYATGYFQQDSGIARNLVYASVSVFRVDTGDGAAVFP